MANGVVWTGVGAETHDLFPPLSHLRVDDMPIENKLSIALRVSYGPFDYFTGGDLSANGDELLSPAQAWQDVETPVARASGPVDVLLCAVGRLCARRSGICRWRCPFAARAVLQITSTQKHCRNEDQKNFAQC